jgi:hypothetical protein
LVNSKVILVVIAIITGTIIGIVAIVSNSNDNGKINEENIIDERIFEKIENIEVKSDREILTEVEELYNNLQNYSGNSDYVVRDRIWQSSGPFAIDRYSYSLGEKIFLRAEGINLDDDGEIVFLRKTNSTHYTVWKTFAFNGMEKNSFNVYFDPVLSKNLGICSKNDLIGEWAIVFKNTIYKNIEFEINEKIVPGDERKYDTPVC